MLGGHCLRGQSTWQSTVALSSGESEYYAIVKAAAQGLHSYSMHTAAICADLGLKLGVQLVGKQDMQVEIHSDSSAARAFAQRAGLGKQKHVHTRLLWIQEQVEQGRLGVLRVGTRDNEADLLTKPLAAPLVRRHLASIGFEFRNTWSKLHRGLEADTPAIFPTDQLEESLERPTVKQRIAALEEQLAKLRPEDKPGRFDGHGASSMGVPRLTQEQSSQGGVQLCVLQFLPSQPFEQTEVKGILQEIPNLHHFRSAFDVL
eukprot:5195798-Amphidinium_carterae.1